MDKVLCPDCGRVMKFTRSKPANAPMYICVHCLEHLGVCCDG